MLSTGEPPLEPCRSYTFLLPVTGLPCRIRVTRIREINGRWFAIGIDLDNRARRGFYVDTMDRLKPAIAG